jgi:hypothetical protein
MADSQAWSEGSQLATQQFGDKREHKRNRQEQLQDEQRQQKLQVYADLHNQGRISPAELGHAIEDIYHDEEPEKKMSIFGRLLNRQKAKQQHDDYLQGKQKRATEEAGILSGAKAAAPSEQEAAAAKAKAVQDILSNPNLTDDQKRTMVSIYGAKMPAAAPKAATPKPVAEPKPLRETSDERTRADFAGWKQEHPAYKGTFEDWKYERTHPPKAPKPPGAPKLTAAQNQAQKSFVTAKSLASIADQVAQKPNDAVNQKRLAVALERVSAGRFTTQALDYIVKAGWGNTLQQWANNPSTGALPPDIMRQLVDGAHENLKAAQDELDSADELAPKPPGSKKAPAPKKEESKKIVVTQEDMK